MDELLHSGSTVPACDVVQSPPSPQTSVPAPLPLHCTPIIPEDWNADPPLGSVLLHQSSSNPLVIGSAGSGLSAACLLLPLLLSLLEPGPAGTGGAVHLSHTSVTAGGCVSSACSGSGLCLALGVSGERGRGAVLPSQEEAVSCRPLCCILVLCALLQRDPAQQPPAFFSSLNGRLLKPPLEVHNSV